MLPTASGVAVNHEGPPSAEISHTSFTLQPPSFPPFAGFPSLGTTKNPLTASSSSTNPYPWACRDEEGIQQFKGTQKNTINKRSEAEKPKPDWVGDNLSVGAVRMKRVKTRRKVRDPRFCFKTMSDVDVLDDGYKWRKYGQKVVKNTQHPRQHEFSMIPLARHYLF